MSAKQEVRIGNCLDLLRQMPDESVDVVVTSPPYWALRNYGSDPVVWGGDPNCEHSWEEHTEPARGGVGENANVGANRDGEANNRGHPTVTEYCTKCGAWKGQLGLEPTPFEYIDHLMLIFDEVKRVLKPTGACWVNIGDTYNGAKTGNTDVNKNSKAVTASFKKSRMKEIGPKSKCMVPERFAIAMCDHGWILRNEIVWCLDESTEIMCKVDGMLMRQTIPQIGEKLSEGKIVTVPTMDREKKPIWTKVRRVFDRGVQKALKVTCKNGKSVICSPEHEFPVRNNVFDKNTMEIRHRIKKASDIIPEKDHLIIARGLEQFDEVDNDGYEEGYCVGFFLAEGNFVWNTKSIERKMKDSVYSMSARKRWAGHVKKEVKELEFSCGVKDETRGYLDIFEKRYAVRKYDYGNNSLHVRSSDQRLVNMVCECVEGRNCHEYRLRDEAYTRGTSFLKGVVDGFLNGDGHYDVKNDRWVIGTCVNWGLLRTIENICTTIGYEMRVIGERYVKFAKDDTESRPVLKYTIRKKANESMVVTANRVETVEELNDRAMWDMEVEDVAVQAAVVKNSINNLYFLGNGIWTHNCKPNVMPQSVHDRFTVDFEPFYFFTKEPQYYFNQLTEPIAEVSKVRAQYGFKSQKANGGSGVEVDDMSRFVPEERNMRCVWSIPTSGSKIEHCAMFPKTLVERPIKACCPEGGVVLDPFAGSGTVLEYCFDNDIRAIGMEINPDFREIIEKRMNKRQSTLEGY